MPAKPAINWFACSICGEPTSYKRTSEDGYHHGHCKQCKQLVRLMVAYREVEPASSPPAADRAERPNSGETTSAFPCPCQ